jgi:Family of unknown function (DUF5908)
MPIVVREMIIRSRVEEVNPRNQQTPPSQSGSSKPNEQLVALCVEKVMEAIERKRER